MHWHFSGRVSLLCTFFSEEDWNRSRIPSCPQRPEEDSVRCRDEGECLLVFVYFLCTFPTFFYILSSDWFINLKICFSIKDELREKVWYEKKVRISFTSISALAFKGWTDDLKMLSKDRIIGNYFIFMALISARMVERERERERKREKKETERRVRVRREREWDRVRECEREIVSEWRESEWQSERVKERVSDEWERDEWQSERVSEWERERRERSEWVREW